MVVLINFQDVVLILKPSFIYLSFNCYSDFHHGNLLLDKSTLEFSYLEINYSFFLSNCWDILIVAFSNCPLDCCLAEDITHEQSKSLLKYDVMLASSSPVIKQCPYNEAEKVYRYCRERFPNNSEWTDVDFSQCRINLESLNQVGECFFWWKRFLLSLLLFLLLLVEVVVVVVVVLVLVLFCVNVLSFPIFWKEPNR